MAGRPQWPQQPFGYPSAGGYAYPPQQQQQPPQPFYPGAQPQQFYPGQYNPQQQFYGGVHQPQQQQYGAAQYAQQYPPPQQYQQQQQPIQNSFEIKPKANPLDGMFGSNKPKPAAAAPQTTAPVRPTQPVQQPPKQQPIQTKPPPPPPPPPADDDFGDFGDFTTSSASTFPSSSTGPTKPAPVKMVNPVDALFSAHKAAAAAPSPVKPAAPTARAPSADDFDDFQQAQPQQSLKPSAVATATAAPVPDVSSLIMQNLSVAFSGSGDNNAKKTFETKKEKTLASGDHYKMMAPSYSVKHEVSKTSVNWSSIGDDVFGDVRPKGESAPPPSLLAPTPPPPQPVVQQQQPPFVSQQQPPFVPQQQQPFLTQQSQPIVQSQQPFVQQQQQQQQPFLQQQQQPFLQQQQPFLQQQSFQQQPFQQQQQPFQQQPFIQQQSFTQPAPFGGADDFDDFVSADSSFSAPVAVFTSAPSSATFSSAQSIGAFGAAPTTPAFSSAPSAAIMAPLAPAAPLAPSAAANTAGPQPPSQSLITADLFQMEPETSVFSSSAPQTAPSDFEGFSAAPPASITPAPSVFSVPAAAQPAATFGASSSFDDFGGFTSAEPTGFTSSASTTTLNYKPSITTSFVADDADFGDFATATTEAPKSASDDKGANNDIFAAFAKSSKYQQAAPVQSDIFAEFAKGAPSSASIAATVQTPVMAVPAFSLPAQTAISFPKHYVPQEVFDMLVARECLQESLALQPFLSSAAAASYSPSVFQAKVDAARASRDQSTVDSLLKEWEQFRKTALPADYGHWEQLAQGNIESHLPTFEAMHKDIELKQGPEKGSAFTERFPVYLPAAAKKDLAGAVQIQQEIFSVYQKLTSPVLQQFVQKWQQVLVSSQTDLKAANQTIQSIAPLPEADKVALAKNDKFKNHVHAVEEIGRIGVRISKAAQSQAEFLPGTSVQNLLGLVTEHFNLGTAIQHTLKQAGLDLLYDYDDPLAAVPPNLKDGCAVCMCSAAAAANKLVWAGETYHAPCANYWFNRVQQQASA